jgi:Spy/CpxP family protein refolding chaperone
MSAVPGERDRIQAIIGGHMPKVLTLRAAAAQARRQALATLASAEFSKETFSRSLADVANADGAPERENVAMMAQSLAVLTPQERQAMVTRTKARNRSWFWRMFRLRLQRFQGASS